MPSFREISTKRSRPPSGYEDYPSRQFIISLLVSHLSAKKYDQDCDHTSSNFQLERNNISIFKPSHLNGYNFAVRTFKSIIFGINLIVYASEGEGKMRQVQWWTGIDSPRYQNKDRVITWRISDKEPFPRDADVPMKSRTSSINWNANPCEREENRSKVSSNDKDRPS